MLYNIIMMFCFVQFITVALAALLCISIIKIVHMYNNTVIKVNNKHNVNNYYFKNRGVRGVVRIIGGRSFTSVCVALDTRAKRKALTAVARKEAWMVKHTAWLYAKNKMYARTKRVRKQMRFATMQYVQTSNVRSKHVVASKVYTNAMPKVAMYTSTLHVDMVKQAACALASVLLHTEDKALKGKATLNEQAQRTAMAAIWAGNLEARAVFSALRTEGKEISARRTQIWGMLNGQVSNQEVAS